MKPSKTPLVLSVVSLIIALGAMGVSLFGEKKLENGLASTLKSEPSILVDAIKENPADVLGAIQEAALSARDELAKKKEEDEKKQLENYFENPLEPKISKERAFLGSDNAPLVLVEYSDFECPFCKKGLDTVNQLREKYGDKIKFVYKHLPLNFHDNARISAQYFEAIALQDPKKAYRFHDLLFAEQSKLKRGESFLKSIAEKAGANMARLAKDLSAKEVLRRIQEDEEEAASFGIQGTPGFILNGIPVKGAYPAEYFNTQIIDRLVEKGKVTL